MPCRSTPALRHVLVRHEQAAAHAADGYARASGRPGVCVATSGPGATNLVTGLATAQMDSSPVVAITGQVPRAMIGRDAFQETDIIGITLPITKHSVLVQDISELAEQVREVFHIATEGRPGPVLIDIPKDVQNQKMRVDRWAAPKPGWPGARLARRSRHPRHDLQAAVDLITHCRRPLLMVGTRRHPRTKPTPRCARWPSEPASRSSPPCSASAPSPSPTRSTSACPACMAKCTSTGPSSTPT